MKRNIFLNLISFFVVLVLSSTAFCMTPYDDFSVTYIDKNKWRQGEMVREIDLTNTRLLMKHASPSPGAIPAYPYWDANRLAFVDPNSVNSIQADVTILEADINNQAETWARVSGVWYHDGTAGGGMIGNIVGEIFLRKDSTGLYAAWEVVKLTNTAGNLGSVLGYGKFTTPISAGTTYTLYVSYDAGVNQFTFRVGAEEKTFGPDGLPTPAGNATIPSKVLGTRVDVDDSASSGYISVAFDNIYKNGILPEYLYDDFSSLSIDQTKWSDYEYVREISGENLRSKVRSSTTSTPTISGRLEFLDPSNINVIQTKVTPTIYENLQAADAIARIGGFFYNDGTAGGGYLGVVGAEVRIGGTGQKPRGGWSVWTYSDTEGNNVAGVASGTFTTPITLGDTYTLFLAWDGNHFTFKINDESASYTPVTSILPPDILWKEISTRIRNPAGKEATIEAFFDDVEVNSIVVIPEAIDFGAVSVNGYLDQPVAVINDGQSDVTINAVTSPSSPFAIPVDYCTGRTVPPGYSCSVYVSFSPTAEGKFNSLFTISSSDPGETFFTVNLLGAGALSALPDLVVTSVNAPSSAITGQQIEVSWTVANQGNGTAQGSWFDSVYLSTDGQWDANDVLLTSDIGSRLLLPGSNYSMTRTVTIPGVPPGTYYLIMRTDWYFGNGSLFESNESNNFLAKQITITVPDLVVTSLNAPSTASTGQQIDVSWTVANQGDGTAQGFWFDSLYLSMDDQLDINDTSLIWPGDNRAVLSGNNYSVTRTATIPGVPAGTYYLIMRTDVSGYIYESNETNNTIMRPITIMVPDLVSTALAAPASALVGQQIELSWRVQNQGSGEALSSWYDRIYLSNDTILDSSDISLNYWFSQVELPAGGYYTFTKKIPLPIVQAGDYYLILRVDAGNDIFESNEANNDRVVPIKLTSDFPLCTPIEVGISQYKLNIPQTERFYVTLQSSDYRGASAAIMRDGQTIASVQPPGSGLEHDSILELKNPQSGDYSLEIVPLGQGVVVRACPALPVVKIDELFVGTIYQSDGYDWSQLDVPEGIGSLDFTVETVGNWSKLDVWRGSFDSSEHWYGESWDQPVRLSIQNPQSGRYYLRVWNHAVISSESQIRNYSIRVQSLQPPIEIDNNIVYAKIDPNRGCVTNLRFKQGTNQELIDSSNDRYLLDFGSQDTRLRQYLKSGWHVEGMDTQADHLVLRLAHPSGFKNELALLWQPDRVEVRSEITAPESLEINNNIKPGVGFYGGSDKWVVPSATGIQTGSFTYPGTYTLIYPSSDPTQWATPSEGWMAFWNESTNEVHGFTFSGGYQLKIANGVATDLHFMIPAGTSTIAFHVVTPKPGIPYEAVRGLTVKPSFDLNVQANALFVGPGAELTYTLAYGNTGNVDAANVVIEDCLPLNLELVEGTISTGGTYNSGTKCITWNIASLTAGVEPQSVMFKATVAQGVADGTKIVDTARIWSTEQPIPYTTSVTTTITTGPSITSISPNKGGNAGSVTVTINGSNFDPNAEVKLTKTGEVDIITASMTGLSDGTRLTAAFDLTGRTPGVWNLTVTNPSNVSVTFPNAFTIEVGGEAKLWVEIVGGEKIRAGRVTTFQVRFGNSGDIDAERVYIVLGVPAALSCEINLPWSMTPYPPWKGDTSLGSALYVTIIEADVVRAGSNSWFDMLITSWATGGPFTFYADIRLDPSPYFESLMTNLPADPLAFLGFSGSSTAIFQEPIRQRIQETVLDLTDSPPPGYILIWDSYDKNTLNHVAKSIGGGQYIQMLSTNGVGTISVKNVSDYIAGDGKPKTGYKGAFRPPWWSDEDAERVKETSDALLKLLEEEKMKARYDQGPCTQNFVPPQGNVPGEIATNCVGFVWFLNTAFRNSRAFSVRDMRALLDHAGWRDQVPPNAPAIPSQHSGQVLNPGDCQTWDELTKQARKMVDIVTSFDPNDKASPAGFDAEVLPINQRKRFVPADRQIPYVAFFENLETATAPVQDMSITDQLDSNLDWSTLSFDTIQVGNRKITLPQSSQNFSSDVDLRPEMPAIVQVQCNFNPQTGVAQWYFRGTDPYTGLLADFLPPNTSSIDPKGRGWVSYSVKPKANLPTGTIIKNKATIDFEVGVPPESMDTPEVFNTLDSVAPSSSVSPLSATQNALNFTVSWSGNDDPGGSGIRNYDIYVSDNGGPYTLWVTIPEISAMFTGEYGHQYSFYSRARDNVGNIEDVPTIPDATTQVVAINRPPIANAGIDQTVQVADNCQATVTLNGTGSSDPDGDVLTYGWVGSFGTANGSTPSVNLPLGTHTITLTVNDGKGGTSSASVSITVADTTPPTITAPAAVVVKTDPGKSEAGNVALGTPVTADNCAVGSVVNDHPSNTFPLGETLVTWTVTDSSGNKATAIQKVTVLNTPPVAAPTATPSSGSAPLTVQFAAVASDADGDALTFVWDFGDGNTSILENPSHIFTAAGGYVVGLTVSDGKATVSRSLSITVSAGLSFSVRTASAKFYSRGQGRVALWADVGISKPAPRDVLALDFDGIRLFTLPFSSFRKGLLPDAYLYEKNGLIVRLDFRTHRLFVYTPKMAMPGVDNSNGVDIRFLASSVAGAENIVMRPTLGGQLLVYVRPGLFEPPPNVD